jgi:hypothetical protein
MTTRYQATKVSEVGPQIMVKRMLSWAPGSQFSSSDSSDSPSKPKVVYDDNKECVICCQEYTLSCTQTRQCIFPCGHTFCVRCAVHSMKMNMAYKLSSRNDGYCPLCRARVGLNEIYLPDLKNSSLTHL